MPVKNKDLLFVGVSLLITYIAFVMMWWELTNGNV
jgi:nitrogen fixation-related uncharacterized protein